MLKHFSKFWLINLLTLLSIGAVSRSAIANQSLNVTIEADQINNYGRLMEQAIGRANDAIANTFETNPNAAPIKLTVLINRNGQVLPMMVAEISRDQWQQEPDVQSWARYSTSVRVLLGYAQPTRTAARPQAPRRRPIIENAALIDALD